MNEAIVAIGDSSWLSALPLKSLGYALNKQEFRDAVSLRSGWKVKVTPNFLLAAKQIPLITPLLARKAVMSPWDITHSGIPKRSSWRRYAKMYRWNQSFYRPEKSYSYKIEQLSLKDSISARGIHNKKENTFFDILVMHPNRDSNNEKSYLYKT